jgi:hypothetical protein
MRNTVRIVVCSRLVAKKLRALAPQGVEIIVDDRTLNRDGLEMLRQRVARLAWGGAGEGERRGRK